MMIHSKNGILCKALQVIFCHGPRHKAVPSITVSQKLWNSKHNVVFHLVEHVFILLSPKLCMLKQLQKEGTNNLDFLELCQ